MYRVVQSQLPHFNRHEKYTIYRITVVALRGRCILTIRNGIFSSTIYPPDNYDYLSRCHTICIHIWNVSAGSAPPCIMKVWDSYPTATTVVHIHILKQGLLDTVLLNNSENLCFIYNNENLTLRVTYSFEPVCC